MSRYNQPQTLPIASARPFGFSALKAMSKKGSVTSTVKLAAFGAILAYLMYQLTKIGWTEIVAALPRSPLFYVLSIGFVLAPVLAEIFAFKTITGRKVGSFGKVFLRKHVFNKAVMNFTGDAYFVQKLSQLKDLNLRRAAIVLKDMTLIRAFIANAWIVALVIAALCLGKYEVLQNIVATSPMIAGAMGLFTVVVVGSALVWFKKITRLTVSVAAKVASIYLIRSFVVAAILISQWSLAIPGQEIATWFLFLLVFSLTKKSPVGGELVFASVVVTLPGLGGDTAAVAAMLVAIAAVTQLLYFIGFILTLDKTAPKRIPSHRLAIS